MRPSFVLKNYPKQLSIYEMGEILEYSQIYYFGQKAKKKVHASPALEMNNGFDDDQGDYKIYTYDHIQFRYEIVEVLGKGSFGQVVKAFDHKINENVALKIIKNKKKFHKQGLVEVKLLEYIRDNDPDDLTNNVRMFDYFFFRNHLCMTFELLSLNLYEFMKETNFQPMSTSLIRRFAIQILNSLQYLFKHQIIHCDLKPENILLKNPTKSGIKVIDFGSSCFVNERIYSYIQSRFYRAPEVILGMSYHTAIDMWSFGCILCELHTGWPLFPGETEIEQIIFIMEVLGLPPMYLLETASRRKHFFDQNGKPIMHLKAQGKIRKPGQRTLFRALNKCNDTLFIDFVERCLQWDPKDRLTPELAIQHPFILGV
ncbi:MAG: putative Dual specificity protein kinase pom1 [Streblomastix strix]|uniref:dual-specificity kinase n=1 Tax=Streblomastix strix TaxID=222440 RepID=A0A5J4WML9_9EUKA|nr:MAG: putative Dual specificity protein kinase pom1 [Streblomastix strix]